MSFFREHESKSCSNVLSQLVNFTSHDKRDRYKRGVAAGNFIGRKREGGQEREEEIEKERETSGRSESELTESGFPLPDFCILILRANVLSRLITFLDSYFVSSVSFFGPGLVTQCKRAPRVRTSFVSSVAL